MDIKVHSDATVDGNEDYLTGNWRKGHPHYKVAKNLVDCVHVLVLCGRQEFISEELEYLVEETKCWGVMWLFMTVYGKIWEKRN
jgi:hypothetical protein